jgi:hypothetical protein
MIKIERTGIILFTAETNQVRITSTPLILVDGPERTFARRFLIGAKNWTSSGVSSK